MAKPKRTLVLSQNNARHIETFTQYSQLTGIPLADLLDERLGNYLYCAVAAVHG